MMNIPEHEYELFEQAVAERVGSLTGPVFDFQGNLWYEYLGAIPVEVRQHYNCRTCERFVNQHGGIVTINRETGETESAIWKGLVVPPFFVPVRDELNNALKSVKIMGVHVSDSKEWGIKANKGKDGRIWSHLHGVAGQGVVVTPKRAAEVYQDMQILRHGMKDYPKKVVEEAVRVLKSDTLNRSEKALGIAEWVLELHVRLEQVKGGREGPRRQNLIWLAAAQAPAGFCHIRSTIISTLMDDIVAGLEFGEIRRRWSEKVHPLQYQRPTAAPSDQTIKQAEELVRTMGLERSLRRRYAVKSDLQETVWIRPSVDGLGGTDRARGVFDHLKGQGRGGEVQKVQIPAQTVTWARLTGLVDWVRVKDVAVYAPDHGSYYGLVTAVDWDAPPILQWDQAGISGRRNPVSWYYYHPYSVVSTWNLSTGWNPVTAIFWTPWMWGGGGSGAQHRKEIHLAIEGARDQRNAGLALFPETLKSELHGVRKVIEAFSASGKIEGADSVDQVNGISVGRGVRIRIDGVEYMVDRLE